jgi:cobalt-zinc-cadmium efflux system outer membrane protein
MSPLRLLPLAGLLLLGGCLWPVRERTDQAVRDLASRPYDLVPEAALKDVLQAKEAPPAPATPPGGSAAPPGPGPGGSAALPSPASDIQTTAFLQAPPERPGGGLPRYELQIPSTLPGSEAPLVDFYKRDKEGRILRDKEGRPVPMEAEERRQAIQKLYPPLAPLPVAPAPQPGPNGRPYTLTDLQQMAAVNSPTLRQAASDVDAARGALVQAKTWTNPTVTYSQSPTNNNSNAGAGGFGVDQIIHTGGKWKMGVATAQKALDNAELALRRARSDLATAVRNAYFGVIVAAETVRVSEALARFTDEIYRLYTGYLSGGFVASYEPAALQAQAYATRMAYQNAITGYWTAWKQLVATVGLEHLPLTEVAGRVDRLIPYYDYDKVLAHVLARHTDVLVAQNSLDTARYNLKLAQITPLFPDLDVSFNVWKESTIPPYVIFYQTTVGFPMPIWDQNKGNIIAAQAALVRATEETHRVAVTLTNGIAAAYATYKTNLDSLEYYRRHILPGYVRAYRGVFQRRQIDINASPGDLVTAQQTLATGVSTYLGILGSLWSGAVSVADFLQTDDLFQVATPHELPELPDLGALPHWPCPHGRAAAGPEAPAGPGPCACTPAPAPQAAPGVLPGLPAQAPAVPTVPSGLPSVLPELPAPRKQDG